MLKNFEIKDATMLLDRAQHTVDAAKKNFWHIYKTDLRDQKEK